MAIKMLHSESTVVAEEKGICGGEIFFFFFFQCFRLVFLYDIDYTAS